MSLAEKLVFATVFPNPVVCYNKSLGMAKSVLRANAIRLRKEGRSIKEIAKLLSVSSSTVSVWCKVVILTSGQIEELQRRNKDPYFGKRLEYLNKIKAERKGAEREIHRLAVEEIGNLSARDKFLLGVSLYWAEGFKKDNMVGFANSDPRMIKFILAWIKDCLGVSQDLITLRVGINESHIYRIEEIEQFWMKVTGIPKGNFRKPYFQKVKWVKVYESPEEYFGILRIRVLKSTNLLRKIKGYIAGIAAA